MGNLYDVLIEREEAMKNKSVITDRYELYNGDCLEVMESMPDKSIDMILCDLPYGTTWAK